MGGAVVLVVMEEIDYYSKSSLTSLGGDFCARPIAERMGNRAS
jgi:hypothetical protein